MSLYLKYRPQTFADVVWQQHITDILLAQVQTGKFSHNYLLYGPRGTGKTSSARLLAKAVNATTDDLTTDPAAHLIDKGQTLDFVEIDAASHTGVDNIREEIIDKALYPPTHLKKKVYVIDEVHMLSKGAFNALLKIMEEPPEYLMFILATTEINKVPDTIISRCQVFNFKRLTIDDIVGRLTYIAEQEQIEVEEEWLRLIAKLSSGALRDGIKFLEQVSMLGKVTQETVSKFLGVVSESVLTEFVDLVKSRNYESTIAFLNNLVDGGTDLTNFAKDLLVRIDEHFLEDVSFSAQFADMLREIISGIKGYPYPLVIYKTVLRNYLQWATTPSGEDKKKETTIESKEPRAKSQEKDIQPESVNVSDVGTNNIRPDEVTIDKLSQSVDNTEQPRMKDEEKDQNEKNKPTDVGAHIIRPDEISQTSSTEPKKIEPKNEGPGWGKEGTPSESYEQLLEQVVAKVDKIMIKSVLKKQAIIDSLEGDLLKIIIISEQFFNTLQKPENVTYMQEIVSDVRGTPTTIAYSYMSKEDYLTRALHG